MSCGAGCRRSTDLALLWLWHRLEATVLIQPIAWKPPCASGVGLERQKRKKENNVYTPVGMPIIQKTTTNKGWRRCGEKGTPCTLLVGM